MGVGECKLLMSITSDRAMQSYAHTHGYRSACIGTQRLSHVTGTYLYSVQYNAPCSIVCPPSVYCVQ